MRATNYKHYGKEQNDRRAKTSNTKKSHKALKATSAVFAVVIAAAAFIVPTTTLAPGVEAYADSRVASYSVGDIDKFSSVIKSNCVEETTAPVTEVPATVEETTQSTTVEATTEAAEETKPEESKVETEEKKAESSVAKENTEVKEESSDDDDDDYDYSYASSSSSAAAPVSYSGATLVDIANPDPSYNPSYVSLSSYDRAKLERLVMGEAGTMGYTGCALVAQSIRDAMNRSGTSSIDQIISEYQYFGSTSIEPNQDVKDAVSFIFDQNGSAVQHRVLCFYIGYSAWHETQTFLTSIDGVRFFDLNF